MPEHSTQIPHGPTEYRAFRKVWAELVDLGKQAGFVEQLGGRDCYVLLGEDDD